MKIKVICKPLLYFSHCYYSSFEKKWTMGENTAMVAISTFSGDRIIFLSYMSILSKCFFPTKVKKCWPNSKTKFSWRSFLFIQFHYFALRSVIMYNNRNKYFYLLWSNCYTILKCWMKSLITKIRYIHKNELLNFIFHNY